MILLTNFLVNFLVIFIWVHIKGTKYFGFGNKVMNRQLFHRKTIFHMKIFKKFDSKIINRQYFHRETGLKSWLISL